jgi:hypothetical protein
MSATQRTTTSVLAHTDVSDALYSALSPALAPASRLPCATRVTPIASVCPLYPRRSSALTAPQDERADDSDGAPLARAPSLSSSLSSLSSRYSACVLSSPCTSFSPEPREPEARGSSDSEDEPDYVSEPATDEDEAGGAPLGRLRVFMQVIQPAARVYEASEVVPAMYGMVRRRFLQPKLSCAARLTGPFVG